MRLRLESPGAAPYWLVGDPALNERTAMSRALDDQLQITRQQQAVPGAGYWAKEFHDRGNQAVKFDATASREFYDEIERMDFLSRVAALDPARAEHAWEGRVCVREQIGTRYREWPLEGAVVSLGGLTLEGQTRVRLRYQVQAPGFGPPVDGEVEVVITAEAAEPAEVSFGGWEWQWLTYNGHTEGGATTPDAGAYIQVELMNWYDPGIYVIAQFQVDAGYGVSPGPVVLSPGDNLSVVADWLNTHTEISAAVSGGDLVLRTPARAGDFITLQASVYPPGESTDLFSQSSDPVESAIATLADISGRTLTAETRPITAY